MSNSFNERNLTGNKFHVQMGEFDDTIYRRMPNTESVQRWIQEMGKMKMREMLEMWVKNFNTVGIQPDRLGYV